MKKESLEMRVTFRVNAVEPALPGRRRCPPGGEAAEGRFGGDC